MFDSEKSRFYRFLITAYTYFIYLFFEKPRGVDFIRTDDSPLKASSSASYYISVPKKCMAKMLDRIPIRPEDSFLDIGSGKGFILYLAHKKGFSRVHGIELSPLLCRIASKNMKTLKVSQNVTVECMDASRFKNLDQYSFIFMNNPFSDDVMKKVIHNIETSLKRFPRKLTIIYLNPRCHDVLDKSLLLELAEKRSISVYNPMTKWKVFYYRSAASLE